MFGKRSEVFRILINFKFPIEGRFNSEHVLLLKEVVESLVLESHNADMLKTMQNINIFLQEI